MAVRFTTIRVDAKLADEAARALGAKSRAEAVRMAVRTVIGNKRPAKKETAVFDPEPPRL
jgi:Arc/MetJ family transcription regulator